MKQDEPTRVDPHRYVQPRRLVLKQDLRMWSAVQGIRFSLWEAEKLVRLAVRYEQEPRQFD